MLSVLSSAPLEDLEDSIRALADEALVHVTGDELVLLQRLQDRLAAETARRLAAFDRDRGFAADGYQSTSAWLRARCRLSHSAATVRVSVARQLVDLPQTHIRAPTTTGAIRSGGPQPWPSWPGVS